MDEITFPAKVLKPLRITIPESVGELLDLHPGDLIEVKIKKLTKSSTPAQPTKDLISEPPAFTKAGLP